MKKKNIVIFWIARRLLALRYRIRVEGLDALMKDSRTSRGGILFLPNHPAEIDPPIVSILLEMHLSVRPLVVEHFYYAKALRFFMRITRSLPLPALDVSPNPWKAKQVEKRVKEIQNAIQAGENFLIYPAGKLKQQEEEVIGGASFIHTLLQSSARPQVVLVRTTGLWGSHFSRALTGQVPDFGKTLWTGFKILLRNGIVFAPRRKIKVEFEFAPADFPFEGSRLEVNQYLESWYNRSPDKLYLVSDCLLKKRFPKVAREQQEKERHMLVEVSPELEREIFLHLAQMANRSPGEIKPEMSLSLDLGLDSLDVAELYAYLDERFDVTEIPFGALQSVQDVLQTAAGVKSAHQRSSDKKVKKFAWPQEKMRPLPMQPVGESLQEAFLMICEKMKDRVACADDLSGVFSYKKLQRTALVLSLYIRRLPGEQIGIMLPASTITYTLVLATLLAKKIPVMLNWTAGVRSLNHASHLTKLQTVLSSRRFLSRREIGELGEVDEKIVLLEDVKDSLTWKDKLHGLFLSLLSPKRLLKKLKLTAVKKEDVAVILFTSGTESLPKAVPLSHNNLLTNQRAAIASIDLTEEDLFFGVLPPFHSFGFSITGLLPLLAGLKVAYAPDPTDSHGLAFEIARYKPTLFCCAPSFIKGLFRVANPNDLRSIRYFVSGAEKAPQELFQYVKNLGAHHEMLEGYGITECAPVVTLTPPHRPPIGVGRPVPGVEISILDPLDKILPIGEEGEICIFGPNVFAGYLGHPTSPFVEIEGKRWYCSGDRGYLDKEGNLILSGRMRRFIKIGGEMVSLSGLEEEILKLAKEKRWLEQEDDKPVLAISVREKEADKPLLILVTTFAVDKERVNSALREGGFGRIVKIHEVRRIEEIPLTGTGKTHYRLLDEMVL